LAVVDLRGIKVAGVVAEEAILAAELALTIIIMAMPAAAAHIITALIKFR
jgi:hypothetical protein